jgi:hypothetical protein
MIGKLIVMLLLAVGSTANAEESRPFELKGSIEYAEGTNQYLLAYTSNEASSGPNVYGRVVSAEGVPQGKDFRLSTQTGAMSKPDLAYGSKQDRFLVIWGRKLYDEGRSEIIAQVVGANGKLVGSEFRVSFSDYYETRPAIAYCPTRDKFLVTWTRGTAYDFEKGQSDIYGQIVDGDGAQLVGSNFVISTAAKNQFKPDVTCDSVNDRFLVVWEDQRQLSTQDDIYGQFVRTDGSLLGQNLLLASSPNIDGRPVVAANTKNGSYLLVWESVVDRTFKMSSQILDTNGIPQGSPVALGADLGGGRNRAAVAYLKQQNVYFVVFDNSAFDDVPDGIFGQFVQADGTLRQGSMSVTTAPLGQYRPDLAASKNSFFVVWTDYRDTANTGTKRDVYEYYGRVIGNDMPLSSRWKNPESR